MAPSKLTAADIFSDTVTLTWRNLPLLEWNGEFQNFKIWYESEPSGPNTTLTNTTSVILSPLLFGTKYIISVAFIGSGGIGPNSSIHIKTKRDCKYLL